MEDDTYEDLDTVRKRLLRPDAPKGVEFALHSAITRFARLSVSLESLDSAVQWPMFRRAGEVNQAASIIRNALRAEAMSAKADIALLAHLCKRGALRKYAVEVATGFIRREDAVIMDLIDPSGECPSMYLISERDALHDEIIARFDVEMSFLQPPGK